MYTFINIMVFASYSFSSGSPQKKNHQIWWFFLLFIRNILCISRFWVQFRYDFSNVLIRQSKKHRKLFLYNPKYHILCHKWSKSDVLQFV